MTDQNYKREHDLDGLLDQVDYSYLNSPSYFPSQFALTFMNFIKLVNGDQAGHNKTPPMHLAMLDKLEFRRSNNLANLMFRGAAKTSVFMEYMTPFIAVMEELPILGKIDGFIYVSDSIENGVKSARKNIEFRYEQSPFLQEWLPHVHFTDNYMEFKNKNGHRLGVKMFGAKALSLDSKLYLASGGTSTIGGCAVGDLIMGADGKPTRITRKSGIFHKPMYELVLQDGRRLKVSEDHLNQVHIKRFRSEKSFSTYTLTELTLTTKELLRQPLFAVDPRGSKRPLLWVENCRPMEWPENQDLLLDPYTVGVLLGDGSLHRKADGSAPVVLTAHEDDWPTYEKEIPYALGRVWRDTRRPATISRTVVGIAPFIAMHGLDTRGEAKRVPKEFLFGSVAQRLAVLQGLMDTDGTCTQDGKSSFCSASRGLVEDVAWLVRSLGGEARWLDKGNARAFQCSARLGLPLFRLQRKLVRQRPPRNDKMAIVAINPIADEPSQCIAVDNGERQFVAEDFFRTHNTGLRGSKIFGKRPKLAILDDLISDEDATSKASMEKIFSTVYDGIGPALDPNNNLTILNGTPFHKDDLMVSAVESGGWEVNVWPVCERFPCSEEEFQSAWPDRFTYAYVKEKYEFALKNNRINSFMQELMLRITSEEGRLVQDGEINWYSRKTLLNNRQNFNFYITTDFATSAKQKADYSVISVWAYNAKGDWFWVDGICRRQTMDKTINDLFRLVQEYEPLQVGIEVSGQQGAFIKWLQGEQANRNIWFTFASSNQNGAPGIRPTADKLKRFNVVVPWFKAGKMFFPEELRSGQEMGIFMGQIRLATHEGLKGKDDFIDTISMLAELSPYKPANHQPPHGQSDTGLAGLWEKTEDGYDPSPITSYLV